MFIDRFEQDLYPAIYYKIGNKIIKNSFMMIENENTTMIRFELLEGKRKVVLRIKPLLAYRSIHNLTRQNIAFQVRTYFEKNGFKIEPYLGMPPLYIATNRHSVFYPGPIWYNNLEYLKENRRGYDYQEDLFCPGIFEIELSKNKPLVIAASTKPQKAIEAKRLKEEKRRQEAFNSFKNETKHMQILKYNAKQFLINNSQEQRSITAGYHWFGEWGRDTMISLPGLTFYCNRMEEGIKILKTYADKEKSGLIPNFLGNNDNDASYNSIDASLWFFWAVQEYLRKGGKKYNIEQVFFKTMTNIIKAHIEGKVPLSILDDNGLIHAGDENTQLTWMDAKVHGKPVTPRNGAAVEINALWYNALEFWYILAKDFEYVDDLTEIVKKCIEKIKNAFAEKFWNNDDNCLADVINWFGLDRSIRPNQIFAVSLPYSPLNQDQQKAVVKIVKEHLLTPVGLRSLSPRDREYRPFYEGNPETRDSAYHQGTVWTWLIGHFGEAYLKTEENNTEARKFLKNYFHPVLDKFPENFGISSIPEIYNGNPPYNPKGCISQAWSLAEVIRLKTLIRKK